MKSKAEFKEYVDNNLEIDRLSARVAELEARERLWRGYGETLESMLRNDPWSPEFEALSWRRTDHRRRLGLGGEVQDE